MQAQHRVRCFGSILALSTLLGAFGCGGGDSPAANNTGRAPARVTIAWGARSRAIQAPASAQWARVVFEKAGPNGEDTEDLFRREDKPEAHTKTYATAQEVKVGTHKMTVEFLTDTIGEAPNVINGDVIAEATAMVTLNPDGSGVPDIATDSKVASVRVVLRQTVVMGRRKDLDFAALDQNGSILLVSPAAVQWSAASSETPHIRFIQGQAEALNIGMEFVRATIDGITSEAIPVFAIGPGEPEHLIARATLAFLGNIYAELRKRHFEETGEYRRVESVQELLAWVEQSGYNSPLFNEALFFNNPNWYLPGREYSLLHEGTCEASGPGNPPSEIGVNQFAVVSNVPKDGCYIPGVSLQ